MAYGECQEEAIMNRDIRVDNVLYDHAKCTAFIVFDEEKIHTAAREMILSRLICFEK